MYRTRSIGRPFCLATITGYSSKGLNYFEQGRFKKRDMQNPQRELKILNFKFLILYTNAPISIISPNTPAAVTSRPAPGP